MAAELVLADGSVVRADESSRPELLWALRGGGGNVGVVTALEIRLFPSADAYAGMLLWDLSHAEPVLRRWATWSAESPDEVTTSFRFLRFPPLPELPDFLRGRQLVVVDGAILGDDARGEELLAPLRELGPEMDTFTRTPSAALTRIHMDPEGPTPAVSGGTLLGRLDDDAIEAFLLAAGPGASSSLLAAELRQLGGALGRAADGGGALPRIDGAYAGFFVAIAATPEMAEAGAADAERLVTATAPWSTRSQYLNFAETPVDTRDGYAAADWDRLQRIRSEVDPQGLLVANHPIAGSAA